MPDYAYPTIGHYEACVGHPVNEAFRIGWDMARTLNSHLRALAAEDGLPPSPEPRYTVAEIRNYFEYRFHIDDSLRLLDDPEKGIAAVTARKRGGA